VVTQLGYDARKFQEALLFTKLNGLNVPIVGNIYILPYGIGKMMNENKLPGCVVTDKLLAELDRERQAQDKGMEARLLRAAKMYAFMKGMGFDGVHIGGHGVQYEQVLFVIEKGEELSANWQELVREFDYPQPGGFYLYEQDKATGLNLKTTANLEQETPDVPVGVVYSFSRMIHRLLFEPDRNLFGLMRSLCRSVEGTPAEPVFHKLEHLSKVLLYGCRDCGDCALVDLAYVCPMSQCPKNQRNGACGGSFEGWCEVYPGKRRCVYVTAYARLKHYREQGGLDAQPVPPCNWDFNQTSAWINYYLGRDHSAGRFGIRKPEEQ
jgi:methylenetetrahydrofolate reductase (NADPH)